MDSFHTGFSCFVLVFFYLKMFSFNLVLFSFSKPIL